MTTADLNRLTYTQDQIDQAFSSALRDASVPMDFWHKPGATIAKIESRIRSDIAKRGCRLVVIDYIQLVKAPGFTEPRMRVTHVSNEIQRISKELNIPIVMLAQVGRQSEGAMPELNDLKESGSIEEDSDVVILLHREKRDSEDLIAKVAKQRSGEISEAGLAMRRGVVMSPAELGQEFHGDFAKGSY
jgi:replicative DNA helicase